MTWLSAAFKKLDLSVILPGHVYTVISSIALQDLTASIIEPSQAYAMYVLSNFASFVGFLADVMFYLVSPITNNATDIVFKNPFGFSLTVEEAGGGFTIAYKGVDAALLNLPLQKVVSSETSTGQPVSSRQLLLILGCWDSLELIT